MYFSTNKQKGNTSLGIAIAYFSANGYTVSIPLNDTQDYDLVIEKDSVLQTFQVKSSACKNKAGNYQLA
jgi:HJR/Mrr/RecB family endonuclease